MLTEEFLLLSNVSHNSVACVCTGTTSVGKGCIRSVSIPAGFGVEQGVTVGVVGARGRVDSGRVAGSRKTSGGDGGKGSKGNNNGEGLHVNLYEFSIQKKKEKKIK